MALWRLLFFWESPFAGTVLVLGRVKGNLRNNPPGYDKTVKNMAMGSNV